MIKNVSRSLIVDVMVERAYEIWSDFSRFPAFVRHVEQVRVEGRRLRWRVLREEWEALITELTPNERVSWHRLQGPRLHAVVSMSPTDDGRTKVTLGAEYEVAPGVPDDKGAWYEQILRNFKEHAEAIPPRLQMPNTSAPSARA
jgi:uncharacterized membrane protein